ncbi:aldehyde dehydrogenase (NADP(+)) [Rhodopirellula sp. ICT_H3.1]|uniref:Aldehyde dehydrogenase (NADP(+)) n=2 Tax=Aporhodopirellula aestuarii TaxID=2950107 RepID=A0ABT0TWS4_9BACT|nr:aldehyde dehydrogenase (NADP(+)) [Aporhodopirellula aestuarii]MCM2369010.1 aldehyde dehydrogenase (NADP(+)) [Aporhodopirellula aestuarii]
MGNADGLTSTDIFHAFDAATGQPIEPGFAEATAAEIDAAAVRSAEAAEWLAHSPPARRAELLERVAQGMDARQDEIVQRCVTETGYLPERVIGEFRRASGQLRAFAGLTRDRYWDQRQIAAADPNRELAPGLVVPRPEMRRRLVPVGPVAVFGACNFPLAISVVGNDFVAAIAVGCPVIVKSHPSHPGTCELLGQVVCEAVEQLGMPAGTFSLLHGRRPETSISLVQHPAIAAVGFTGSPVGGRALAEAVLKRDRPIPIFAELGSTNPVFITAAALEERCEVIAKGFADSLRFGNGHMCTKPGVVVVPKDVSQPFVDQVIGEMSKQTPLPLLSGGVAEAFDRGIANYRSAAEVQTLHQGGSGGAERDESLGPWHRGPHWFAVEASAAMENHDVHRGSLLHSETFGPVSLLVRCCDEEEMLTIAKQFHGSLTTTLHRGSTDDGFVERWLPIAERFAGRIIYNGWPTGMEIGPATQHGGPYPASLDGNSTSVGYESLRRFVRPVCYQNWPAEELDAAGPW